MLAALHGLLAKAIEPAPAAVTYRLPCAEESFPKQWAYESFFKRQTFVATCCGRRGGKTSGIRRKILRLCMERPGFKVLYVTLTHSNVKTRFWSPFKLEMQKRGIKHATIDNSIFSMTLPNGSYIQATSCDNEKGAGKIRGDFFDLIVIDEVQEISNRVLEPLVNEVLGPAMLDRGGSIELVGTPPDREVSFFLDCFNNPKWQSFNWSVLENPNIPKLNIFTELERLGHVSAEGSAILRAHPEGHELTDDQLDRLTKAVNWKHPIVQREYLGKPLADPTKKVWELLKDAANAVLACLWPQDTKLPTSKQDAGEGWSFALGLDTGFRDHDALVVVGWNRKDPLRRVFEVWHEQRRHQDIDQTAQDVLRLYKIWKFRRIVADQASTGGGLKTLETIKNRLTKAGLPVEVEFKPVSVETSVGLVNDDLRAGRLFLRKETDATVVCRCDTCRKQDAAGKSQLVLDMLMETWRELPSGRREIHGDYHSDLAPALRYAHDAATHFRSKAPPKPPSEREEWLARVEAPVIDTGEF